MATDIKPGSGCPGKYYSGRIVGLCSTQCARMGGRELQPALTVKQGLAECENFLQLSMGAHNVHAVSSDASVSAEQRQVGAVAHGLNGRGG